MFILRRRLQNVSDFAVQFYRNLIFGITILIFIAAFSREKTYQILKNIGRGLLTYDDQVFNSQPYSVASMTLLPRCFWVGSGIALGGVKYAFHSCRTEHSRCKCVGYRRVEYCVLEYLQLSPSRRADSH